MSNRPNGTLYVGVTNDLVHRARQHREGLGGKFTKRYGLDRLVYYEHFNSIDEAIWREKRIKTWLRAWKVRLIHRQNPACDDLAPNLVNELPLS
jgi:putative endonuclease